jgi:hypothetical protein
VRASAGAWWTALLLCGGCGCRQGCAGELPPPAAEATAVTPPALVAPAVASPNERRPGLARTVGDVLCINEAVSVPERLVRQRSIDPAAIQAMLEDDARLARSVGATTVRANSANYPYNSWYEWSRRPRAQDRSDRYVALVQEFGLEPLLMIGPWPGNRTANYTERYVPDDMQAYTAWVERVVERYDGDGQEDAPGLLRPVRLWEVDNEPDLHNRIKPKNARRDMEPSLFETPAQYAEVLIATAAAIRRVQPDAIILNAGTFDTDKPHGRDYLAEVFAVPGAREAVDALSVHAYFGERSPERFLAALDNAEALAQGMPIFVTETGVPSSHADRAWVDERYHARMLAFVYGEALSRRVDRVCWHTLADPPPEAPTEGGFSTHSLHRTVGTPPRQRREPKLAAQLYQRLAEQAGEVPLDQLERISWSGARVLRLGSAGWLVYEGKLDLSERQGEVLDLLTGELSPLDGAVDAPAIVRLADEG